MLFECGRTVPKDLSVRIERCAHCQGQVRRDVNTAPVPVWAVAAPWSGLVRQTKGLA